MGANPLVSICIPVYNGAAFLRECLDSCLGQSYENYEVIVCDDGSTDASVSIIHEYAAKHARLRFFQNSRNLGLVGNWNRCMEHASGEWIKYVFQDDYIQPLCLEKFVAEISPSVHLVLSERHFVLPPDLPVEKKAYYGQGVRTLMNTTTHRGRAYSARLIAQMAVDNMALNFIGEPSLTFFRKSVTHELGVFSGAFRQICDLEFALRIAGKYGLRYIPEKLCAFRVHGASTTATNIGTRFFELRYIEPVIFAWHLLYSPLHASLRSHLGPFRRLKLNVYFRVKAYEAGRMSRQEHQDHPALDPETSPFREIARHQQGSFWVKWISRIRS